VANRLATATSPYLLQHAENPVDWWPWEPAAFDEAQRRDVPVLLSVGYAACHWCHVMAHESFEDPVAAAYLNEHFLAVKVDREERPDVDAVYMAALQAMTGRGGWPMTLVLDHEGNPFFAGTYFPGSAPDGQSSFTDVLRAVTDAWGSRRGDVRRVAQVVRGRLVAATAATPRGERAGLLIPPEGRPELRKAVVGAIEKLAAEFDDQAGGFGSGPKFPPTTVLEFLRRRPGDPHARNMLKLTTAAMARGGLYDQLAGGFARYSVDRHWVVPHFEKMLFDNAQLLGLYARLGTSLGKRVSRETGRFLVRELRTSEGGFASALDADSEGAEGRYYVWSLEQLTGALGAADGLWAAEVFGVTDHGTFEPGNSTLQLPHDPAEHDRFDEVKAKLLATRDRRARPARDDKVIAAWNGLAISGLTAAGLMLEEDDFIGAAVEAGELLARVHVVARGTPSPWNQTVQPADGTRLLRVSRDGVAGRQAGVLEDYGCVASGFLDLVTATGDPAWLDRATSLLETALALFAAADGGFYDTATDAEPLLTRPRDARDIASPSGLSSMIHALLTAHALTGEARFRDAAEAAIANATGLMTQDPLFAGWSLAAAATVVDGPLEVAIVGPATPARDALARKARRIPGAVVVVADDPNDRIPLLVGRTAVNGRPAAYVCRGFTCEPPVTDPSLLP
jgi:hypothetical protein